MDDWKKFNETSLPEKGFHSHLIMEDISDTDYTHKKRVCKDFKIKRIRRISGFVCPKRYIMVAERKDRVKKHILTDIDMLSMAGKGIRGGLCHCIHQYSKANNRYRKDYDKNK